MKLSVIICSYNGERYIEQQINSILQQIRLPNEIIVIDDNSSDDTFNIARDIVNNIDIGAQIICERNIKNLGYVKNFEKASQKATGDIVVFADQDDWWYPEKLQKIEQVFEENPTINFAFSDGEVVDSKLNKFNFSLLDSKGIKREDKSKIKDGELFSYLLKYNIVTGATMAVKREFLSQLIPFPEVWVHDAWVSMIASEKQQYYYIDECLIKYRIHENNNIGTSKGMLRQVQSLKKQKNTAKRNFEQTKQLLNYSEAHFSDFNKSIIKDKNIFFESRYNYPNNSIIRFFCVFKNVLKGNYKRFANGKKSALKDL
ncbi:glycosyltransferase, partial [Priestia megaterium]|uniref:glycosyltransferase n=1 Tax=Priestia megaterium TaxID=1404 RepID=UPI00300AD041